MFDLAIQIAHSDKDDLRSLMTVAKGDPTNFFRGADFRDADLRGEDLRGCDLTGARFEGATVDSSTQVDAKFIHLVLRSRC